MIRNRVYVKRKTCGTLRHCEHKVRYLLDFPCSIFLVPYVLRAVRGLASADLLRCDLVVPERWCQGDFLEPCSPASYRAVDSPKSLHQVLQHASEVPFRSYTSSVGGEVSQTSIGVGELSKKKGLTTLAHRASIVRNLEEVESWFASHSNSAGARIKAVAVLKRSLLVTVSSPRPLARSHVVSFSPPVVPVAAHSMSLLSVPQAYM